MASIATDQSFFKIETGIAKSLLPSEKPIKSKHIRSTIVSTFTLQGAKVFWSLAVRHPIMDNQFVAWKFCHLLHKVLSDGHSLCSTHSMDSCDWLVNMGKLWGLLTDSYGPCIQSYSKFLNTKITFQFRNPRFSGALDSTSREEMEGILNTDNDSLFQLCIELLDYMDDLIAVAGTIFDSLSRTVTNSLTESAQCRIDPIPVILADCLSRYEITFKVMKKLHQELPADLLIDHRSRYDSIITQLVIIAEQCRLLDIMIPDGFPTSSLGQINFTCYTKPTTIEAPSTTTPAPQPSAPSEDDRPLIEF